MTADQLRQALEPLTSPQRDEVGRVLNSGQILVAAARSWLNLQQGDEAIVEKVTRAMRDTAYWADEEVTEGRFNAADWWDALTRAALAAIVEEEQK